MMIRSLIPIAVALLFFTSVAALFAAGHFGVELPWSTTAEPSPSKEASDPAPQEKQEKSEPKQDLAAIESSPVDALQDAIGKGASESGNQTDVDNAPALDISRVSETEASVFAGRAKPNTYVTLLADGTPVGTAKADANGDWSLVTEHKFASKDPAISFTTSDEAPAPPAIAAAPVSPTTLPDPKQNAGAASDVLKEFENMVAEAREDAAREKATAEASVAQDKPSSEGTVPATPENAPSSPPAPASADNSATAAAAEPKAGPAVSSSPATEEVTIPVPIMFDYNAATLTAEGDRAARLLLEYVTLRRLSRVALSGHADERGSDDYNVALSRERLDAVAKILREGGYTGSLDLVPKGKSEPYMGVDRSKFSGEALYQLDRRVELRFLR